MFEFVKNDNGQNYPVIEEKLASAGTFEVGDALVLDSTDGYVKACGATAKPEFICACKKVADTGDVIAVNPVYDGQTWKTAFAADGSSLKAGAKVTLSDAKKVTATTTNGVAELVENGGATGASVLVKF